LYYKLLRKRVVFTAHNVNAGARDGNDSFINRLSLRVQYKLCDEIFVHTAKMKYELVGQFDIPGERISLIPYGINNVVPDTALAPNEARERLGIGSDDKVLLFFGSIAPYKGLEYLLTAFDEIAKQDKGYRLIIAGKPKWDGGYWSLLEPTIASSAARDRIIRKIEFVSDEQTEVFFKAADVLVLPYTHIFQSGILFIAYNFGLPVIASDVGSMREEIIDGRTGFVCKPRDRSDLARTIVRYFQSDLYRDLEFQRVEIKRYANETHSWSEVARITASIYSKLSKR
nr:glycosyltransferase family 4 protein [Blastocatellia bacterium]